MPVHNDCTKVAFQELEAVGIKGRLVDRGKHQAMVWDTSANARINGRPAPSKERSLIIAVSPSDWRAPMATRSEIRKMLKEDGLLPASKEEERDLAWREEIEKKFGRFMVRMEQKEKENQELIQKLKKMENDIEGLVATLGELPQQPPAPNPWYPPLETTAAPGTEPKQVVFRNGMPPLFTLTPPVPLVIPPALPAKGRKPNEFWQALEAQMAKNVRLPARKGFRVVPEHYERVVKEEAFTDIEDVVAAMDGKPSPVTLAVAKIGPLKLKKDGTPRKKYTMTARGFEALKKNAARAREALAKKMAEKRAEKELA